MKRAVNILKDYKYQKVSHKISPTKRRVIEKAIKKAVDEYGETYRLLANE